MFYDNETPTMFDPSQDIAAVFIDFENMKFTVEEAAGEPFQTNRVLDWVNQNVGRVAIKKAYANWHYVNPLMYDLLGNNVDMIQVYPRGMQRKNAADIRLAADAMETLFMFPHITTFVLVASDSDYTGVILKLREHGKKVVGVGTREHTSEYLVQACNLFRFYRTIVADDPEALKRMIGEIDFQEAKSLLVKAMRRHRFADRPAVGRWLRWQMIQIEHSFDERDYGYTNFRDFLNACSDVVRVTEDGPSREVKVDLVAGVNLPDDDEKLSEPAIILPSNPPAAPTTPAPEPAAEAAAAEAATAGRPRIVDPSSLSHAAEAAGDIGWHGAAPTISVPTREEEIRRSDYLRTLWLPRIYLYGRNFAAPLIREMLRINGPGKPLSQLELEEHLINLFGDRTDVGQFFPRFELNQKSVYAIQKLLFWAGTIRFLENDENTYWKMRKREIKPEYATEETMFEQVDFCLAQHFIKYLPLAPDVLTSIFQGSDSLEYAQKIVARVKQVAAS
jgi:hypothetical protein